jgi:uncharacterized protein YndB with AHSA1/START domain
MNNNINISYITIHTGINKVWEALTNPTIINSYIKNMKVESDWKEGSVIKYTCYEEDGSVSIWNGNEAIWIGKIIDLELNKRFLVKYDGSGGLIQESYDLEEKEGGYLELKFTQEAVDEETAKNYVQGNEYTLQSIKFFLEK